MPQKWKIEHNTHLKNHLISPRKKEKTIQTTLKHEQKHLISNQKSCISLRFTPFVSCEMHWAAAWARCQEQPSKPNQQCFLGGCLGCVFFVFFNKSKTKQCFYKIRILCFCGLSPFSCGHERAFWIFLTGLWEFRPASMKVWEPCLECFECFVGWFWSPDTKPPMNPIHRKPFKARLKLVHGPNGLYWFFLCWSHDIT